MPLSGHKSWRMKACYHSKHPPRSDCPHSLKSCGTRPVYSSWFFGECPSWLDLLFDAKLQEDIMCFKSCRWSSEDTRAATASRWPFEELESYSEYRTHSDIFDTCTHLWDFLYTFDNIRSVVASDLSHSCAIYVSIRFRRVREEKY